MSLAFDVIVIGAGPGGYPAAIRAAQLGLNVACVERENLGGVCLNWGCIPTKALLKSAELANKIRHAEDYGFGVEGLTIQFDKVIARSRRAAGQMERGVTHLFKKYGVTSILGNARLGGSGTVVVTDAEGAEQTISAPHIIVATGARARTFPGIEPDGERLLTYREAIVHTERPASVTILGSGAIGLEFAYFWNAMGAEVTVVEGLDEILPREDRQIAREVRKQLSKQGIQFKLGTFVKTAARDGEHTKVTLQDGTEIVAEYTLIALGITPNTDDIGLDTAGVRTQRGFIEVDGYCRTNVTGLYAVGDVTTHGGLAHTATAQAHVAAEFIAGNHASPINYDAIPGCTYCQPQVASVGATEEALKSSGQGYTVGVFPFIANGKAVGAGSSEGFVKVLIDPEFGEILGAHIVGSEATEMIAEFGLAISQELTKDEILHTVHAHPTYSEAMFEAVAQAFGESVHI